MLLAAALAVAAAGPALAQQIEASFDAGYSGSEGINASQNRPLLGQQYSSLDVKSGGTFGFTVGAFFGPNLELEFLWHRQFSELEISEPAPSRKLANQDVDNYHGNLVYNWGESDARIRPFIFGGLGATHYLPGDYDSSIPNGATLTRISSVTRFSSTWGGGVKLYPAHNIGVKGTMRWTPTYIKSDPGGLWCDPFYPTCWVVGNADYSNQFEFSGGITFRFGGR
jgi:opacity protein-like surface antigen